MDWLRFLLLGILVDHCSANLDKTASQRAMSFGVLWAEAEKAHSAQIALSDMEDAMKMLEPLVQHVSGSLYTFRLVRQSYVG